MKYQFENDLGILNYLSGTNEKSAIVLTQPEMELKPLIAPEVLFQQFEIDSLSIQIKRKILRITINHRFCCSQTLV
jgi:hypothetical protein